MHVKILMMRTTILLFWQFLYNKYPVAMPKMCMVISGRLIRVSFQNKMRIGRFIIPHPEKTKIKMSLDETFWILVKHQNVYVTYKKNAIIPADWKEIHPRIGDTNNSISIPPKKIHGMDIETFFILKNIIMANVYHCIPKMLKSHTPFEEHDSCLLHSLHTK